MGRADGGDRGDRPGAAAADGRARVVAGGGDQRAQLRGDRTGVPGGPAAPDAVHVGPEPEPDRRGRGDRGALHRGVRHRRGADRRGGPLPLPRAGRSRDGAPGDVHRVLPGADRGRDPGRGARGDHVDGGLAADPCVVVGRSRYRAEGVPAGLLGPAAGADRPRVDGGDRSRRAGGGAARVAHDLLVRALRVVRAGVGVHAGGALLSVLARHDGGRARSGG